MLYVFLIAIAILTMVFGCIARKKIAECKTEEEKKIVRTKWQIICGLMGVACIILA